MKKILTILLFFAMFIAFSQQIQVSKQTDNGLMKYMLQNKMQINLTQGIDVDAILQKKPFDYNNFVFTSTGMSYYHPEISTDNNFISDHFESYYQLDFAEDPFDGRIQVLVMGEPLPSQTVSLVLGILAVGSIVYLKKNQKVIS